MCSLTWRGGRTSFVFYPLIMPSPDSPAVSHNAEANRYEIEVGGHLAVAEYQIDGGRITFLHTFVPPAIRGRGVAEKLVRGALDDARSRSLQLVPKCSYVEMFIQRNPEYQSLLASSASGNTNT